MRRLIIIVSIDTEEDQWGPGRAVTLDNIEAVPAAAERLSRLGIRPTWYTAWTVVANDDCAAYMTQIHRDQTGEVAAHLHPWNTPPGEESQPAPWQTMLCNLPEHIQDLKIQHLTKRLTDVRCGDAPTAFRAGRWGLGPGTIRALARSGYTVDSSVMPFISWANEEAKGPNFIGAPFKPYWIGGDEVTVPQHSSDILEIPASVGFTRRGHRLWRAAQRATHRASVGRSPASNLLWRTGGLRKVVMTPEMHGPDALLKTARALEHDGVACLHLYWHSQSMTQGLGPFSAAGTDGDSLFETMATFVDGLRTFCEPVFMTASEAATEMRATM
ncbi:MAG: hypothetical protein ACI9OJ_004252 [Myxococcota bacterium]